MLPSPGREPEPMYGWQRDLVGADKLLFGTDMPSALKEAPYGDYVRWIREMEGLNDAEREQILYQNAAKVYAGLS